MYAFRFGNVLLIAPLTAFLVSAAAAGFLLMAGWLVYRVAMPIVIERARM